MKRWILVMLLLGSLLGLIGWRVRLKQNDALAQIQQKEKRQKNPPLVGVTEVTERDIIQDFEAVGSVEAPYNVQMSSKITGRIEYLQVHEGDVVTKGQVLVRLDISQLEAQVNQQQASLAETRSRLAQAQIGQAPANAGIISQIHQQDAALASAKADLEQTKAHYEADIAGATGALTDANARYLASRTAVVVTEANVRNAEANLANTKSRYDRLQNLLDKGFVAAQVVDDARTAMVAQQTAVEVVKAQVLSAMAQRDSNLSLRKVAEKQLEIVKLKGPSDLQVSQAKLDQVKAALEFAKANRAQKPAYQQNIEALKSAVKAAEASLQNTVALRAEAVLKAPIDGYVTGRTMDVGTTVSPGQMILTVQEFREVWATIPVPEEISRLVKVGQSATVSCDAVPGKIFPGRVVQLNPSADPSSRQFTVRVLVNNAANTIKPGMFTRVHLTTERQDASLVVPKEAVQLRPEGSYVIVVGADKHVTLRTVVTGTSDTNYIALLEGVKRGETVVILSASALKEGQEVKIEEKKKDVAPSGSKEPKS